MLSKEQEQEFYIRLGDLIRSFRLKKEISQEAMAQHLGLSRVSIVNIEKAKQKIQLHTLIDLSKYLEVSVLDLLPRLEDDEKIERKLLNKINKEAQNDPEASKKIQDFIKISLSKSKK